MALAEKSVRAIAFVPTHVKIASSLRSATLVLSLRSAGKWSWKRTVSCEEGSQVTMSIWMFIFLPVALRERYINTGADCTTFCRDYMIQRFFCVVHVFRFKCACNFDAVFSAQRLPQSRTIQCPSVAPHMLVLLDSSAMHY